MTAIRSLTTCTIALTIVVAQLLCGCMAMSGAPVSSAVAAVDTSQAAMPCHGAPADPAAPEDSDDRAVECTHCLTSSALVADAFSNGVIFANDLPSWAVNIASIVPRAPPSLATRLDQPDRWRAPTLDDTLVSHRVLLLI